MPIMLINESNIAEFFESLFDEIVSFGLSNLKNELCSRLKQVCAVRLLGGITKLDVIGS